jgi:hypothetical protein
MFTFALLGIASLSTASVVDPTAGTLWHWNEEATIAWTDTSVINAALEFWDAPLDKWSMNAPGQSHPYLAITIDPGVTEQQWLVSHSLTEIWRDPLRIVLRTTNGTVITSETFGVIGADFTQQTNATRGIAVDVTVETNAKSPWGASIVWESTLDDDLLISPHLPGSHDFTWYPSMEGIFRYALTEYPTDNYYVLSPPFQVFAPSTTYPTTSQTTSPTTSQTTSPTTSQTTSPTTSQTTSPTTSPTTSQTTSPTPDIKTCNDCTSGQGPCQITTPDATICSATRTSGDFAGKCMPWELMCTHAPTSAPIPTPSLCDALSGCSNSFQPGPSCRIQSGPHVICLPPYSDAYPNVCEDGLEYCNASATTQAMPTATGTSPTTNSTVFPTIDAPPTNMNSCICFPSEPLCVFDTVRNINTACYTDIARLSSNGTQCFCDSQCYLFTCCPDFNTTCTTNKSSTTATPTNVPDKGTTYDNDRDLLWIIIGVVGGCAACVLIAIVLVLSAPNHDASNQNTIYPARLAHDNSAYGDIVTIQGRAIQNPVYQTHTPVETSQYGSSDEDSV